MPAIPIPFLINFISAVLISALGFFVLRHDRNRLNRLFALMTFCLALWIFSSALSDVVKDLKAAEYLADLAIIGPFFFVAILYFFIHDFPRARRPSSRGVTAAVLLPPFLAIPFVFSKLNIVSVSAEDWGTDFVPGPLYTVLGIYILAIFLAAGAELVRKYLIFTDREQRLQMRYLAVALGFTVVFGTFTNLVLPLLGNARWSTIGPSSTLFFVVFCAYAIVKHHLLDVKVVAAELLGASLALITFFQLFTASSYEDFVVKLLIFLATVMAVFLLIRSVLAEVRRREEVQHLAAQLAASNKRLRQLDELKSTMVSIASHQIRGPLGGMRGYLTMFRDGDLGPLTDRQREIVKMNINVLTRLLNAVETFLDITRLEAGKMLFKKETLPLDEAVRDVVEEFRIMAEKKGLKLALEVEGPRPVWVEFDPEKIKHVIFNLIDNAMKYTEKGSVTARVRVDGQEAVFEVIDTGMGVPPEDLHRLFGKFERGELVVDRGGSGLGLYVVKMLTELQGGRVWVSSPGAGKGATFSVALPLSKHF